MTEWYIVISYIMKQITINDNEVGAWIAGLDLIFEKTNKFGELFIIGKDADLSETPLNYTVIKFFYIGDSIQANCIVQNKNAESVIIELMDKLVLQECI